MMFAQPQEMAVVRHFGNSRNSAAGRAGVGRAVLEGDARAHPRGSLPDGSPGGELRQGEREIRPFESEPRHGYGDP